MKREILRISNLNYRHERLLKLTNISLCILEGECVGFFGLSYSGKNFLVSLLTGQIEGASGKFSFSIDGQKVDSNKELKKKVYHMTAQNYLIGDWTVAEYIGLVDSRGFGLILRKNVIEETVKQYFDMLGLEIDVSRKLRDISEAEKRVVDLVKALNKGTRLVVIEDEFEGMDAGDIRTFEKAMKDLIAGRMAVIISSNSHVVMETLSDKYVFFSKGQIVKKCSRDFIRDKEQLERYLLGDMVVSPESEPGPQVQEHNGRENVIYRVKGLRLQSGEQRDFAFARGEVTTFLILNGREKEDFFLALSGRRRDEETVYLLDGIRLDAPGTDLFVRNKIVSVKNMGGSEELFSKMTVEENLLMPSLSKLSSWDYVAASGGLMKMAFRDGGTKDMEQNTLTGNLKINEMIRLILERWYFYNPRVLVLFEPFIMCDAQGISIVKAYIRKFAQRGTAVIICQSREEYIEDLSDRILRIR
nr:ATP-binding cassette domain-containing protein [Massilistercora timonensis]